jgi:hypothetical protein
LNILYHSAESILSQDNIDLVFNSVNFKPVILEFSQDHVLVGAGLGSGSGLTSTLGFLAAFTFIVLAAF